MYVLGGKIFGFYKERSDTKNILKNIYSKLSLRNTHPLNTLVLVAHDSSAQLVSAKDTIGFFSRN